MDAQGKTILGAEDHASNRKLLALLLEQAQYEVHLAADGVERLGERSSYRRHVDTPGRFGSVSNCSRPVQYGTRRRDTVCAARQERRAAWKAMDCEYWWQRIMSPRET